MKCPLGTMPGVATPREVAATCSRVGHGRDDIDAVVVSGEEGVTKPSPGIFDIIFERLGNPPRDGSMIVGDSLSSDMKGGANYGIATCWYNPNGNVAGPEDKITYEIKSLRELLRIAQA